MFEIDENSLPVVRTRHALLAIDLQNDFVSPDASVPVTNPPNFVENIVNLASNFRSYGNVIWIRTVFQASRPINSKGDGETVITDAQLPTARGEGLEMPSQKQIEPFTNQADTIGESSHKPARASQVDKEEEEDGIAETYLTRGPDETVNTVSPMSVGTNFFRTAACAIDSKKDLVFQKTYYSAFKDGSLVQILRAKFVTEIYLCGALTNISVFATAMDAARHGYAITIVDDCLGYRSRSRHDEALRQLVELTGCAIISSTDLIQDIKSKDRAPRSPKSTSKPSILQRKQSPRHETANLDNLMARLNLRPDGSTAPQLNSAPVGPAMSVAAGDTRVSSESPGSSEHAQELSLLTRTPSTEIKQERVKTKIKCRRRHSKGGAKDAAIAGDSPGPSRVAKDKQKEERVTAVAVNLNDEMEKLSVTDDRSELCEGDTTIIRDLLDAEMAVDMFERLRDEVRWQKMSHQGGEVPRLVAVQGELGEDGSIPIYRHPADELPPLLQFSPAVSQIRKRVEEKLGHSVNHVLIQFYRDGHDYISEHSDKTLDIVSDTYIANVSLGAQRTMVFRRKKQQKSDFPDPHPRQAIRVALPHNSMCKMGLVTNKRWLHGIRQDKRMTSEKSAEELAFSGGRISLTFRKIGTFLSKDQTRVWGQGATSKLKSHAKTVINGDNAKSEKMIRAFGQENQSREFDWEEHYGEGFDVLHMENTPKVFLSGDTVADLRVKVMLEEYEVGWTVGKLSPAFNWKGGNSSKEASPVPETLPIKFVDKDLSRSTVEGDLAIMLYLDAVYGSKADAAKKASSDLARIFTRFQQTDELLKKWRKPEFSVKPFRKEMELWDGFATEGPFIAGESITLADYAFWPLLVEIQTEWDDFDGLGNLAAYYARLRSLGSFSKAQGTREGQESKVEEQQREKDVSMSRTTEKGGKVKASKGRE
jgi:nicotinamidase-related amidase/alkylated DNA repair dioxygenase AlkB